MTSRKFWKDDRDPGSSDLGDRDNDFQNVLISSTVRRVRRDGRKLILSQSGFLQQSQWTSSLNGFGKMLMRFRFPDYKALESVRAGEDCTYVGNDGRGINVVFDDGTKANLPSQSPQFLGSMRDRRHIPNGWFDILVKA